jgi:uncharacterized phage protein (TIGR01671 family)
MNDRFKMLIWDSKYKFHLPFDEETGFWISHPDDKNKSYTYLEIYKLPGCHERFIKRQSTGLKDKKGKLIFEGDLVRIYDTDEYFKEGVTLEDWHYAIQDYLCGVESEDIEIIGNVYEQPELLEKDND